MEVAKEIRSGDKKHVKSGVKTPIVRRSSWGRAAAGLLADGLGGAVVCGGCFCCRLLGFLGAGEVIAERAAAGAMVCRGWQ